MKEYITKVAMKTEDGMVYAMSKPKRHHDIINMLSEIYPTPIKGEQGFITNTGRFVDRIEAKVIAIRENQLIPRAGKTKRLFSEDLW